MDKKRFIFRVLGNPNRANVPMLPDDIPTSKEISEMDKYGIPYDVDKPLRGTIIELNEYGLKTGGSCCGHGNQRNASYINFRHLLTEDDKNKVKKILSKNGIQFVKFETTRAIDKPNEPLRTDMVIGNILTPKPNYEKGEPWEQWGIDKPEWLKAETKSDEERKAGKTVLSRYKEIDEDYIKQGKKAIEEKDTKSLVLIKEGVQGRLNRYDKFYKQNRDIVTWKKGSGKLAGIMGKKLRVKACAIKLVEC